MLGSLEVPQESGRLSGLVGSQKGINSDLYRNHVVSQSLRLCLAHRPALAEACSLHNFSNCMWGRTEASSLEMLYEAIKRSRYDQVVDGYRDIVSQFWRSGVPCLLSFLLVGFEKITSLEQGLYNFQRHSECFWTTSTCPADFQMSERTASTTTN